MSLISCKNLCVAYDGKTVVNNLSFSVDEGDAVCIVGENGSGKTTLMKSLLGLVKTSGGCIEFSGGLFQNEIGYLPQQTEVQKDFPASVNEIVLSGCLNKTKGPFFSKKEKAKAAHNMELLGITHLKKRCYQELSGGQQQRVLLARALCATRKMLLLDEPVAGLDPIVTAELYDLIKKLNREDKLTVIMVSHDIPGSMDIANKILHLNHNGSFFGTTEEYEKSDFGKHFLGGGANA